MSNAAEDFEQHQPPTLGALREEQHAYTRWDLAVHPAHRPALEKSKLYELIGNRLSIGDEIRVHAVDYSWVATVLVSKVNGPNVSVRFMYGSDWSNTTDFTDPEVKGGYTAKWRGPKRWSIIMKNGDVHADMIDSREEAEKMAAELNSMLG